MPRDDHQRLRNALDIFVRQGSLPNPRVPQIQAVAPHLETREAMRLLAADEEDRTLFIGPPLCMRGAEHVYEIDRTGEKPRLRHKFCYRRKESYVCAPNGVPEGWKDREFDYRERVANYADINWGDQLLWDRSVMTAVFHLADPEEVSVGGNLVIQHRSVAALDTTLEMINGIGFRPAVESLDRAILHHSTNTFYMLEMIGDRLPFAAFNCVRCGGGLLAEHCSFCGAPVKAKMEGRCICEIPLPMEIASGFSVFTTPPIQAVKRAYIEWATKDYNPPLAAITRERERIITLKDDEE